MDLAGSIDPLVSEQRRALALGSVAAHDLLAVAAREAPRFDYHQLNYHKGQIDVGRISTMLGPARTLDEALGQAQQHLAALGSPWLAAPIQSRLALFDRNLGRAKSSTDLAVKAIPVLPAMLGSSQPRHYFVAFMTPAESRGLGGIWAPTPSSPPRTATSALLARETTRRSTMPFLRPAGS